MTLNHEEAYGKELAQHQEQAQYGDEKTKTGVDVQTRELERRESSVGSQKVDWHPGFKQRFPWLGFGAIFMMLLCIAFTIIISVTSNGKSKEEWPAHQKMNWIKESWRVKTQLAPNVALAVVNTVSNLSLAIAIGQGVAIAWWRKAMQGSTVEELHNSWSYSASVLQLLTAGKKFNIVALAALTAKIALVDNLLLQRSTESTPGILVLQNNISLPHVFSICLSRSLPVLPANYAGMFEESGMTGSLTPEFSKDVYRYATSGAFIDFESAWLPGSFDTRCFGLCYAKLPGFGFNVTCDAPTTDENFTVTPSTTGSFSAEQSAFASGSNSSAQTSNSTLLTPTLLYVNALVWHAGDRMTNDAGVNVTVPYSYIELQSQYAEIGASNGKKDDLNSTACTGRTMNRRCVLRPATIEYSVEVTNTTTTAKDSASSSFGAVSEGIKLMPALDSADGGTEGSPLANLTGGQIWGFKVIKTLPEDKNMYTNLQAISAAINSMFSSYVRLEHRDDLGYQSTSVSTNSISAWWLGTFTPRQSIKSCVMTVYDPTTWIIQQVNAILLRASISAALDPPGPDFAKFPLASRTINLKNTVLGHADIIKPTITFGSNYYFLAAAIAVMVFCIGCVLPSYWGFWHLGRKVTLGPMEIASAFQAPVLTHPVGSAGGEVEILLKEVGNRQVRYGEVEGRLAVAEPEAVKKLPKRV